MEALKNKYTEEYLDRKVKKQIITKQQSITRKKQSERDRDIKR